MAAGHARGPAEDRDLDPVGQETEAEPERLEERARPGAGDQHDDARGGATLPCLDRNDAPPLDDDARHPPPRPPPRPRPRPRPPAPPGGRPPGRGSRPAAPPPPAPAPPCG